MGFSSAFSHQGGVGHGPRTLRLGVAVVLKHMLQALRFGTAVMLRRGPRALRIGTTVVLRHEPQTLCLGTAVMLRRGLRTLRLDTTSMALIILASEVWALLSDDLSSVIFRLSTPVSQLSIISFILEAISLIEGVV